MDIFDTFKVNEPRITAIIIHVTAIIIHVMAFHHTCSGSLSHRYMYDDRHDMYNDRRHVMMIAVRYTNVYFSNRTLKHVHLKCNEQGQSNHLVSPY